MDRVKFISIQRAEDIINTKNPKFKWFYQIKHKHNGTFVIFWCENYYRKYVVEFGNNYVATQLVSYLISLLQKADFIKKD